ncbi:glycosyltransferase [Marisediminicola sp. LYQ85]|uniref:glycosyltransferase n=1 Tax=Marisediminicola sp. LYQ85 TaxID=3391062 RepID=UPI0039834E38
MAVKSGQSLSVITVTYQDPEGLERTLNSLSKLAADSAGEIEFVVVDGGSDIDVGRLRRTYPWASIESERDGGIYDAMNKGIDRSTGSFVWFLNGGDECLADWERLRKELRLEPASILMCAYELQIGARSIERDPRPPSYLWHGLPTSHQAIFYPRSELGDVRYDLSYRMSADYQFTAQLMSNGVTARSSSLPVSRFRMDGASFNHARQVAVEAARVQATILHTPKLLRLISQIKHWASRTGRRIQARLWSRTASEQQS